MNKTNLYNNTKACIYVIQVTLNMSVTLISCEILNSIIYVENCYLFNVSFIDNLISYFFTLFTEIPKVTGGSVVIFHGAFYFKETV